MPKLSKGFVKRLNEGLEEGKRIERGDPKEYAVFLSAMNNFIIKSMGAESVTHGMEEGMKEEVMKELNQKIGRHGDAGGGEASRLMRSQSWVEFYESVEKVIGNAGFLRKSQGNTKGNIEANKYLLPAFLKLMDMGYKAYPDLTA